MSSPAGQASTGDFDKVLVVDFGAQYAQLIARRVREANVYSEIVPRTITAAEVAARKPTGIILSGGPDSVYAEDAYRIDPGILDPDDPEMAGDLVVAAVNLALAAAAEDAAESMGGVAGGMDLGGLLG